MPAPTRFPQGISNAAPWQFFSSMGTPNPFYYHSFADDFDTAPVVATGWTPSGTGTAPAGSPADGGTVVLTTTAVAVEFESLQRTLATFQPVAGKKTYFATRVTLSDVLNSAMIAGLFPSGSTTPFTPPANGIWVSKASGTLQLVLNVANNSVVTSTNFPTNIGFTLTNAVSFDIGIHVTGGAAGTGASINATVAPNIVGFGPQSGTGSAGSTNRQPNIASTAPLITTLQATVLAPLVGVQAGTTTIKTMTVDFVGAFRER